jgi:hypothetical protein
MPVQIKGVGSIDGLDQGLDVGIITATSFVGTGVSVVGVITATTFSGSGANLTSLPSQVTISNNADNRVITGGSGTNLNGEANLTFDGNTFSVTTGTGVQHPFNFRNDFTPNAYRSDLLSTGNLTSNNSLRIGTVASSGGVTLQGNRTNDSAAKVNLILNPDGGDVGIGTVSPQGGGLTVVKHAEARLQVWANGDGSNGKIAIRADGGNTQIGTWSNHDMHLVRNNAIQATVNSTGISFPSGKGIDFSASGNAGGMTSELLDDYEEGTFTPTAQGSSVQATPTYGDQTGTYTKVGRLVTVYYKLNLTNTGSNSGYWQFLGLPFSAASVGQFTAAVQYNSLGSALPSGAEVPMVYLSQSNNYFSVRCQDADGSTMQNLPVMTLGYMRVTLSYFTDS